MADLSDINSAGSTKIVGSDLNGVETTPLAVNSDGSINAAVTSIVEVEIKNDEGSPLSISGTVTANQGTTPWIVDGTVSLGNLNTDAFGRLRVSNPFTIFDSSFRYGDNLLKWNHIISGSASVYHLLDESSMALTVSAQGDSIIRETKKVFSYQPGKSLLILNSFVMSSESNLVQEIGYFGEKDGIFFRNDNGTNYFVKRTSVSGSIVEIAVSQENWNKSSLNQLDYSKAQIFWIDIEWLGVGSIRCGFVIDGVFIHCHTFNHANLISTVYMKTATLPLRCCIYSNGGTGTMRQICATVMSEGGYANTSQTRAISNNLSGKVLSSSDPRPLVCIRLNNQKTDAVAVPDSFDVYGLQQAAFKWQVVLNPTLTNAQWISVGASSAVDYDIEATAMSGGTVLAEGIFVGSNKGGAISIKKDLTDFTMQLGRTIGKVSDIICLSAIATTNNDRAIGSIIWQEHS